MNTVLTKIRKDAYKQEERVIMPPVDIYETENEYVLKAEMPGVSKENIEVTLNNDELEINGKIDGANDNEVNLKYTEFRLYDYHRTFTVGEGIDGNALSAKLENGILTVTLPKSEKVKPKRIEVKVEG